MVHGTSYLGSFLYRSQKLPIWGNGRGENILDGGAPFYDVYETADGKYLAVGALEPQFYTEFLRGLGVSEDDAPQYDFATSKAVIKKKIMEKSRREWCEIFDKLDGCVSPVLELNEAPDNEHNRTEETFLKTEDQVIAPTPAPSLSRTPAQSRSVYKRPKAGEHTIEILKELGYSIDEIHRFKSDNVIEFPNASKL